MASQRARLPVSLFVLGFLGCALGGCSSSSDGGPGTGGTTANGGAGSGGATGKGGSSGTGGSVATGGSVGSGGSVGAGGSNGSGGAQQAGGTVGRGGSNSGGTKATGGAPTGGAATGGSGRGGSAAGGSAAGGSAAGGSGVGGSAAGGSAAGGSAAGSSGRGGSSGGGGAAGGSSGTGGSAGSDGKGSPGCGSTSPLKTSTSLTESINGTTRKWMLDVPTSYDTNKKYKLIFVWHPLSGKGSDVVNNGYNGLKSLSNSSAVFATADGLNGSNSEVSGTGWWNANGGDMKLFQAMLDKINAGLCIDQERIFSTGFSFGGMMSYTLPFQFDVFRAVAPCSGKTGVIPYDDNFSDPIAIMAFHGDADTFVLTSLGKAFFDKFVTRNKCGTQTQAVSPSGCVQYQGCTVPTIWCLFPGGHTTWSEEPAAIWKFFSQF